MSFECQQLVSAPHTPLLTSLSSVRTPHIPHLTSYLSPRRNHNLAMSISFSRPVWQDGLMMIFKMWQRDVKQKRAHPASAAVVNTGSPPNGVEFTWATPNLRSRLDGLKTRWTDRLSEAQLSDLQKAIDRMVKYSLRSLPAKLLDKDVAERRRMPPQAELTEASATDYQNEMLQLCNEHRETLVDGE